MDLEKSLKGLVQGYKERQRFWNEKDNLDRAIVYSNVIGDLLTLIEESESQLPREHEDGGYTDSGGDRHKRGCPTRWYDPCTCKGENQ